MGKESCQISPLPSGWDNVLCTVFQTMLGFPVKRAESVVHGLVDILEATARIYGTTIPTMLEEDGLSDADALRDLTWDIREAFRHIDYHIHDAELLDI